MSNLVEEIHSIIKSEVRADWMSLIEARFAQVTAAQVYLVAVWGSLNNTERGIILEKMLGEMTDICTMNRGRKAYPDDKGMFVKDTETPMDYLILATELEQATEETLEAALIEIATTYKNGQWHLVKVAEAMDKARAKIEAGTAGLTPERDLLERFAEQERKEE